MPYRANSTGQGENFIEDKAVFPSVIIQYRYAYILLEIDIGG